MGKPQTEKFDTLRVLIKQARERCDNPDSCPALVQLMLSRNFLKRIRIAGLETHLLAAGLSAEIRRYLKETADEETAKPDQLMLWPEGLRDMVKEIDRERVYVPSIKDFLRLVPEQMTAPDIREAGEYLCAKAIEVDRRGQRLIDLADAMEGRKRK